MACSVFEQLLRAGLGGQVIDRSCLLVLYTQLPTGTDF